MCFLWRIYLVFWQRKIYFFDLFKKLKVKRTQTAESFSKSLIKIILCLWICYGANRLNFIYIKNSNSFHIWVHKLFNDFFCCKMTKVWKTDLNFKPHIRYLHPNRDKRGRLLEMHFLAMIVSTKLSRCRFFLWKHRPKEKYLLSVPWLKFFV